MAKMAIKLSKAQKALREEYLRERDSDSEDDKQELLVRINMSGGLQSIGLGGAINE